MWSLEHQYAMQYLLCIYRGEVSAIEILDGHRLVRNQLLYRQVTDAIQNRVLGKVHSCWADNPNTISVIKCPLCASVNGRCIDCCWKIKSKEKCPLNLAYLRAYCAMYPMATNGERVHEMLFDRITQLSIWVKEGKEYYALV